MTENEHGNFVKPTLNFKCISKFPVSKIIYVKSINLKCKQTMQFLLKNKFSAIGQEHVKWKKKKFSRVFVAIKWLDFKQMLQLLTQQLCSLASC